MRKCAEGANKIDDKLAQIQGEGEGEIEEERGRKLIEEFIKIYIILINCYQILVNLYRQQ